MHKRALIFFTLICCFTNLLAYSETPEPKISSHGYLYDLDAWQMIPGGTLGFLGSTGKDSTGKSLGRFLVALFTPEQLAQLSQGPDGITPQMLKPRTRLIKLPSSEVFNVLPGYSTGGSHIAVGFDPRFSEGPIPISDDNRGTASERCRSAAIEPSPESSLECYRLLLFFPKQSIQKPQSTSYDTFEIHQAEVAVVIDKSDQTIFSAEFVSKEPFYAVGATRALQGFTLTTTSDSRLLLYAPTEFDFRDANFPGMQFIFNERPWEPSGWSASQKLTELHKFGADKEICLNPIQNLSNCDDEQRAPFSQRYSLAQFPLKTADGNVLSDTATTFCSYPWITPDGSEMFCQLFRNNGVAVVGRRTKGTFKLLDGFFNQQDKFSTFGDGHHRISSLGTGSGAWAAYPGINLDFPFPVTGRSNKQTLLVKTMGNNVVYGEADMNDFMDGHYLLYLPFNQMVEFCPHVDGCAKTGLYRTFRYSAGVTPDTSGSFHKAVMNEGSTFSMGENYVPYSEARNTLSNDFQGRAIEFKKGGLVTVAIPSESQLSKPQQNYTIQFAIKPLTLLTATESVRIARKRQSWEISLVGMNHLRLSGAANNISFSKDIPISLPQGLWSHVTMEFIPILQSGLYTLGINVYVNGTRYLPNPDQPQSFVLELERTRTRHSLTANTNPIEIGPGTSRTSLSGTIYALDEFAISKARRTQSEIELAAHLLPDRSAFLSNLTSVAGNPLPLGLKPEDLRIPAQLGPYVNNLDAIRLGQQLFSDPKLSASKEMSCATCHQRDKFFTDGLTTPKNGDRNTPTTANRAFSTLQFFNGRSPNLVEQALQPILNPNEMNADLNTVISYLRNDPEINQGFQKVFGKNKVVTPHRLARVIAAYEVSLLAGNSLVDNLSSLNKQTQVTTQIAKGRLIFQGKGRCVGCHSGSNYSDELFHNTGTEQSTPNGSILRQFKTPTLRNIALTGPYFHDGSKATLDDVIQFYNQGGASTSPELVPLGLSPEEQHALKEFLQALTSEFK